MPDHLTGQEDTPIIRVVFDQPYPAKYCQGGRSDMDTCLKLVLWRSLMNTKAFLQWVCASVNKMSQLPSFTRMFENGTWRIHIKIHRHSVNLILIYLDCSRFAED